MDRGPGHSFVDRPDCQADRQAPSGPASPPGRGRRPTTSRAAITRVAMALFDRDGYDASTVDDIAAALGIGRRTVFRYFASKADIVWGEFDAELARLDRHLRDAPDGEPLFDCLRRAVVATNHFGAGELGELRVRIRLIESVDALVAHSAVRYAEWRRVVAVFAARRLGGEPDDLPAETLSRAALGAATAAFTCWVRRGDDNLSGDLDQAFELLARGFSLPEPPHRRSAAT